ncbi:hypothetical protein C8R45DRAFT_1075579 [Mycena sanguinolenta]|nr:hypothetical protein C8R45DRAFT_1075579 [Mycena sanguinolenta]
MSNSESVIIKSEKFESCQGTKCEITRFIKSEAGNASTPTLSSRPRDVDTDGVRDAACAARMAQAHLSAPSSEPTSAPYPHPPSYGIAISKRVRVAHNADEGKHLRSDWGQNASTSSSQHNTMGVNGATGTWRGFSFSIVDDDVPYNADECGTRLSSRTFQFKSWTERTELIRTAQHENGDGTAETWRRGGDVPCTAIGASQHRRSSACNESSEHGSAVSTIDAYPTCAQPARETKAKRKHKRAALLTATGVSPYREMAPRTLLACEMFYMSIG